MEMKNRNGRNFVRRYGRTLLPLEWGLIVEYILSITIGHIKTVLFIGKTSTGSRATDTMLVDRLFSCSLSISCYEVPFRLRFVSLATARYFASERDATCSLGRSPSSVVDLVLCTASSGTL
jgi:hypothetical protein